MKIKLSLVVIFSAYAQQNFKKTYCLILFVFTTIGFSQNKKPEYHWFGDYFYNEDEALGLAVRFDKGIDSIIFPIDTTLLKTSITKLDSNGKIISPKKVYYAYYVTPKKDSIYKLPDGKIWSNNKSFDLKLDKIITIEIPKPAKPLTKSELRKLEKEKEQPRIKEEKVEELKKLKENIDSRISNNIKKRTALLWTDKNAYKVGDYVRIVIESNTEFNSIDIEPKFTNNANEKLSFYSTLYATRYNNGIERHYKAIIYKATVNGTITLSALRLKSGLITNNWSFKIIN